MRLCGIAEGVVDVSNWRTEVKCGQLLAHPLFQVKQPLAQRL